MEPDLVRIITAYGDQYDRLRSELNRRVGVIWDELGGLTAAEMDRWLAAIVPLITAAEQSIWSQFGGFTSLIAGVAGIGTIPRRRRPADLTGRGVDTRDVYARPIITMRRLVAEGRTYEEAKRIAGARARTTAVTDLALANRLAGDRGMQALGVRFYRRALTGASCELCRVASTQRYRTGDLMPIHPNCDCRVVPIFERDDPGQVINSLVFTDLGEPTQRAETRRHGELGPVLVNAHHSFARLDGV